MGKNLPLIFLSYTKVCIADMKPMKLFKDKVDYPWASLYPNPPGMASVNSLRCIILDFFPGRVIFQKYKSHEVTPLL